MPTLKLGPEPILIIGTIIAILNAVQALTLNIPAGVHAAIAAVIVILGVVLARAGVTPVTDPAPPVAPAVVSAAQPPGPTVQ